MPINKNTVEIKQQQSVVAAMSLIREQSNAYLPIGHSFIPHDILVLVVESFLNDKDLTVKALCATLPYSDMGLRYHFRKLINAGWLELHAVDGDARVKQVKPTEKLSKNISSLVQIISPIIKADAILRAS